MRRTTASSPDVEPWEIPVSRDLVPYVDFGDMLSMPYRPRSLDDVPTDAVDALSEIVGVHDPADLLVLPSTSRPTPAGPVYVPMLVFGVGTRGLALWVDDMPNQRVATVLSHADVSLIEHTTTKHHGQLAVFGAHNRLRLRYRVAAWPAFCDLLTRLRTRVSAASIRPGALTDSARSVTWSGLVDTPVIRLTGDAPEAVVTVGPSHTTRWFRRRLTSPAEMAVLTRHELLVAREVTDRLPLTHGIDLFAVPRTRLRGVHVDGERLVLLTSGPDHALDVSQRLIERVTTEILPCLSPSDETVEHPKAQRT